MLYTKYEYSNTAARLYDPTIARFLSADTMIPNPFDTQDFNRYSYVKNNPLKYVDPSGHYSLGNNQISDQHAQQLADAGFGDLLSNDTKDADLYDNNGENVVGTVSYNPKTGDYMARNTLNGTYEGQIGKFGYSGYLDNSAGMRTHLETGEIHASGGGVNYHLTHTNGLNQLSRDDGYYSHWGTNGASFYSNSQLKGGDKWSNFRDPTMKNMSISEQQKLSDDLAMAGNTMSIIGIGFKPAGYIGMGLNYLSYSLDPNKILQDEFNNTFSHGLDLHATRQ